MRKNVFNLLVCASAAAMIIGCGKGARKAAAEAEAAAEQARLDSVEAAQKAEKAKEIMETIANLPEEPVFDIVTNLGTIKVKLYSKTPKHRENFAKLALEGYYDSLLFHRVIKGFMIQCGDPQSRGAEPNVRLGSGGPGYTVPAEFVATLKHKKGAIAAARTGDSVNPQKASSGSQFYIVQNEETCRQLDGSYTVFGEVIQGIEIIDKIAATPTGAADRPVKDIRIISLLPVQTEKSIRIV